MLFWFDVTGSRSARSCSSGHSHSLPHTQIIPVNLGFLVIACAPRSVGERRRPAPCGKKTKRIELGLGSFHDIPLAKARQKAAAMRALALGGHTPARRIRSLCAQQNPPCRSERSCWPGWMRAVGGGAAGISSAAIREGWRFGWSERSIAEGTGGYGADLRPITQWQFGASRRRHPGLYLTCC